MLPLSVRIAERYVGAEQARPYGRRNAVPGELPVRLPLSKIVAVAGLIE